MSRQPIVVRLSEFSISRAIRNVEEYKRDLQRKTERLCERVAEEIRERAAVGFSGAAVDINQIDSVSASASVTMERQGNRFVVTASGSEAIFIEFGAGVTYNTAVGGSVHPLGQELGFVIGSYGPRGGQRAWLYYENGTLRWTEGTPAQMPMYNAVQSVIDDIPGIAREVFA